MYEINIDLEYGIAFLIHPADDGPEPLSFHRVDPNDRGHVAFYDTVDKPLCMVPLTSVKRIMFIKIQQT